MMHRKEANDVVKFFNKEFFFLIILSKCVAFPQTLNKNFQGYMSLYKEPEGPFLMKNRTQDSVNKTNVMKFFHWYYGI